MAHLIGRGREAVETRAVQRRPKEDRWDKEFLQGVLATPWQNPAPEDGDAPPAVLPPRDDRPAGPAPDPGAQEGPKQVYIRDVDLARYGYTAGCRRCRLMRDGDPARGVRHTTACRARIEEAMRADDDERLRRANDRRDEEIARRLEASHSAAEAPSAPALAANPPPQEMVPGADAEPVPISPGYQPHPAIAVRLPQPEGHRPDVVGPAEEMQVEDGGEEELMGSLLLELRELNPSRRLVREATRLYELLLATGVSPGDARAKIVELYCPPRVTSEAATLPWLSLAGGPTFDLRADADGRSWDFRLESDRRRARARIAREKPFLVIGSPPCTAFSVIQAMNRGRVDAATRARQLAEARVLLGFAVEVYEMQLRAGRHFLHEHPVAASSWRVPRVARLLRDPRVGDVTGDQCRYGLKTRCEGGGWVPARKPTRFMSSSPAILQRLALRCRGAHRHQPLLGNGRASAAAIYPPGLCRAVLLGAEDQYRLDGGTVPSAVLAAVSSGVGLYDLAQGDTCSTSLAAATSEEVHPDPAEAGPNVQDEGAELERYGDAPCQWTRSAVSDDDAPQPYHDEITGKPLPAAAVMGGRRRWTSWRGGGAGFA